MKKIILLISLSIITFPVIAGIYKCQTPLEEPVFVNNIDSKEDRKIEYSVRMPQISENFLSTKNHKKNKVPFLFYYAVDSSEPFMQLSTSYEIAQLQKSCLSSNYVNFVAILNTLYTSKNEIILCKNKQLQRINLSHFPSFNKMLKEKHNFISTGDHTTREAGIMRYWLRYREFTNKAFYNFPLAHPDFLYDFVKLVTSEEELFPQNEYMPFMSLKSHGSKHTVLSGLYDCQIKSKTLNQEKIISSKLTKAEREQLKELNVVEKVNLEPQIFETILSKINLSSRIGIKTSEQNLGDINLGDINLNSDVNSGISAHGLGADDGLGSHLAFGVYHVALNNLLDDLFNKTNKKILGFMILESCDSNRENLFKKEKNPMILGVYSAQYSLWYRNLNWWELLEQAKNSTKKLAIILEENTKTIVNIKEVK